MPKTCHFRTMPSKDTITKARLYCARQERCQQEVRDKLYAWKVPAQDVEGIISQLIGEGFLNEARFAEHYATGKARQKGWGRRKIEQAMRMKGVSDPCIALGLKAIDQEEQLDELEKAVQRRLQRSTEEDPYICKQKVIRYFLGKGFSMEEVERALMKQG
jgi:regulatory protein